VNSKFQKRAALYVSVVTEYVCAFNFKSSVIIILLDSSTNLQYCYAPATAAAYDAVE
jgi:hypothetical protein